MRCILLILLLALPAIAAPAPRPRPRPVPDVTPGRYRFAVLPDTYRDVCYYVKLGADGSYRLYDNVNDRVPSWYGTWWYDREAHILHVLRTQHGNYWDHDPRHLVAGGGKAKWTDPYGTFCIYPGWGEPSCALFTGGQSWSKT